MTRPGALSLTSLPPCSATPNTLSFVLPGLTASHGVLDASVVLPDTATLAPGQVAVACAPSQVRDAKIWESWKHGKEKGRVLLSRSVHVVAHVQDGAVVTVTLSPTRPAVCNADLVRISGGGFSSQSPLT